MYAKKREAFLLDAVRHGLNDYWSRKLTRLFVTHERLAEASCNGDWPCDNGERKVRFCNRCECGMVPSKMDKHGICESCRVEDRAKAVVANFPDLLLDINGDPRGWTMSLSRRPDPFK